VEGPEGTPPKKGLEFPWGGDSLRAKRIKESYEP